MCLGEVEFYARLLTCVATGTCAAVVVVEDDDRDGDLCLGRPGLVLLVGTAASSVLVCGGGGGGYVAVLGWPEVESRAEEVH